MQSSREASIETRLTHIRTYETRLTHIRTYIAYINIMLEFPYLLLLPCNASPPGMYYPRI